MTASAELPPLELQWRQPKGAGLLFLIHGYGEHPASALVMGTIVDAELRMQHAAAKGPIDLGGDRHSFYLVDFEARRVNEESFARALPALDDVLDAACASAGIDRSEAVVAGFSQGAGLAMALAFRDSDRPPPGGLIAFSAPVYGDDEVTWDFEGNQHTKVLWTHGRADEIFDFERTEKSRQRMTAAGVQLDFRWYEGGHVLIPEAMSVARDWLTDHFGGST